MSEPAAILATFSDLKLIRGRKVAQLVFEVPIEQAQHATNCLGFPNAAGEKWCAIALTNLAGGSAPKDSPEGSPSTRAEVPPAKPNSTRAVMMAKDSEFWEYVNTYAGIKPVTNAAEAEAALKFLCNIQSKAELNVRSKAAEAFERLRSDFYAWRHDAHGPGQ